MQIFVKWHLSWLVKTIQFNKCDSIILKKWNNKLGFIVPFKNNTAKIVFAARRKYTGHFSLGCFFVLGVFFLDIQHPVLVLSRYSTVSMMSWSRLVWSSLQCYEFMNICLSVGLCLGALGVFFWGGGSWFPPSILNIHKTNKPRHIYPNIYWSDI